MLTRTLPAPASSRPGSRRRDPSARITRMRAVVIYESLTGNTARAARLVADEVAAQGVDVSVYRSPTSG